MFEALEQLPLNRLVTVVHSVVRMISHPAYLAATRETGRLPGSEERLSSQDVRRAIRIVDEIEAQEGASITQLGKKVLARYSRALSEVVLARTRQEVSVDKADTDRLMSLLREHAS